MSTGTIENFTLNQTIVDPPTTTINQQGSASDGTEITHTSFITSTGPDMDVNITQNLTSTVNIVDNTMDPAKQALINQITTYAQEIKCSNFHGKGSLEDYKELFIAASNIANDVKHMQLDVNTSGMVDFANAADELSAVFTSYISKLESISIIDDTAFLQSIATSLGKIYNLSKTFARFKETIIATSVISIPKSTIAIKSSVQNVMGEIDCAMGYINQFVNPSENFNQAYQLSSDEKKAITNAVAAINNWTTLSNEGVTIAMQNNPDIQYVTQAVSTLGTSTNVLRGYTSQLLSKLSSYTTTPNNTPLLVKVTTTSNNNTSATSTNNTSTNNTSTNNTTNDNNSNPPSPSNNDDSD